MCVVSMAMQGSRYVRTYVHVYARPFCDISTPSCYSVHRHRISVSSHLHTCTTHSPTHTHMPSHMHTSPQIFCAGLLLIIVIDSVTYLLTISSPDFTLSVCVCVYVRMSIQLPGGCRMGQTAQCVSGGLTLVHLHNISWCQCSYGLGCSLSLMELKCRQSSYDMRVYIPSLPCQDSQASSLQQISYSLPQWSQTSVREGARAWWM